MRDSREISGIHNIHTRFNIKVFSVVQTGDIEQMNVIQQETLDFDLNLSELSLGTNISNLSWSLTWF